jgi:tRNA (cytidine/uridine-2'-O-)-methyltransferase
MRIALFEPDIPQNAAALIRLAACFDVPIDIIEPCGFVFSDAGFRRAGMDYIEHAEVTRHSSWQAFHHEIKGRLILMTTRAERPHIDFAFATSDTILLGRESAGVPEFVHAAADARLRIPLKRGLRALNVAQAGAIALSEALRQINGFPT